ncbi:tRNA (guanosine(37)-N1)-methyltransferase TrmD [Patescibacteria group bacterium]|nr:tRNA (guanosine(37)-N1)-methyltransferase TrmD [Patescibacteria group bacterium]
MYIDILTLFPEMFKGPFDDSIVKRAINKKLVTIKIHNLRKWATDEHKTVDDKPYGGGVGMVLKVDPVYKAVEQLKKDFQKHGDHKKKGVFSHIILTTPKGRQFNHRIANKLSALRHLIVICGHYEGTDHRIYEQIADESLSVGDYILTGGELPAMIIIDSVVRLIPNVLNKIESKEAESFTYHEGLLKYPQYTRPEEYENMKVPKILLSGNHKEIDKWREEEALKLTKEMRPDLVR